MGKVMDSFTQVEYGTEIKEENEAVIPSKIH